MPRQAVTNRARPATVQNLVLYSEQFNNAAWIKEGTVSVTANQVANPIDGTVDADLLVNVSNTQGIYQRSITVPLGKTYTRSVWLRCASGTMNVRAAGYFGTEFSATWAVTTTWQRFTASGIKTTGTTEVGFYLFNSDVGTLTNLYAWGAQITIANWEGPYVLTTSAAVNTGNIRNRVINRKSSSGRYEINSAAFNPTSISNMALWLDAAQGVTLNGADVANWADQSGAGNHVAQATPSKQPLFSATGAPNSLPLINFTKADSHNLDGATALLSSVAGYTYFAVTRRPSTTTNAIVISTENAGLTDQIAEDVAYCYASASDYGSCASIDTDWTLRKHVFDGSLSGNSNRLKNYENSVLQTLSFAGTVGATTPSATMFLIGSYYTGGAIWDFDGDIAEILIYSRALTAGEQTQVDDYLTAKYSIV